MKLKDEFESFYAANFGNIELGSPVFYNFPIGIRFEIGDPTINFRHQKNKYIKQAVFRATTVFNELFDMDDMVYVVVNSFEDRLNDLSDHDISAARPLIKNISDEYIYNLISDDGEVSYKRYVFQVKVKSVETAELLERIIRSEIGGPYTLSSCVYIFNGRTGVLYYLYDDRGLDVVANETQKLLKIYRKYNDWILDYDREKIEKTFAI